MLFRSDPQNVSGSSDHLSSYCIFHHLPCFRFHSPRPKMCIRDRLNVHEAEFRCSEGIVFKYCLITSCLLLSSGIYAPLLDVYKRQLLHWFRMSDAAPSGKYAWKYSISQNKNQDPLCSPFQHKNAAYNPKSLSALHSQKTVSYTHLDVYKRQVSNIHYHIVLYISSVITDILLLIPGRKS